MMEHRNGSRQSIGLTIKLSQGGDDLGWYTTQDIGGGGLAIKGGVPGLENNSLLTVQIEKLTKDDTMSITLRAFVIHQDNNVIGLMWAEDNTGLVKVARELSILAA